MAQSQPNNRGRQRGTGLPVPNVYRIWLLVLAILYPLCRWFADVERRQNDWWLSYL